MNYVIGNHYYYISNGWLSVLLGLAVWSLIWKGIALWRAGNNKQLVWFIVMLILNTVGILEIVYILFFSKKSSQSKKN